MSNFEFLKDEWQSLYRNMVLAEQRVFSEPDSTAMKCRVSLEEVVHRIYELEYLEMPYNTDLFSLMQEPDFQNIVSFHSRGMDIIRKTGNSAGHYKTRKVTKDDAKVSLKYTFSLLKWFAENYSEVRPQTPTHFDESFIPKVGSEGRKLKVLQQEHEDEKQKLQKQIEDLIKEQQEQLEKAKESEQSLLEYKQEIESAKAAIKEQKLERQVKPSFEFTEAETRLHLINVDLKEAGWSALNEGRELEFPVKGMPITKDNPNGNGYVDYVLWGNDGKPLALVEAKRTSKDVEIGKHQAFLYANCLEAMYGQRPIIFYTNGYDTRLWDDVFYGGARKVHGFYTQDELQWMIQQRGSRKDLRKAKIDTAIAGRPYQMEAIQRVAETFVIEGKEGIRGSKRNALLVMATGSGKTRTAAALVDMLFKNNWVKRVLFLADRNALVSQAKRNFNEHLPELSSIDLSKEKENDTTRLVFSTYPSMMNKIDNSFSDDERFYGVGHFDLIIIDEAHRSVYNRYKAIFDYFDALLVGLTATPKESIDHNTFELFDCGTGDPTFSYELDEAVASNYLVPFENLDVSTKFLREGIKYAQLSADEKAKYEDTFRDSTTGLFPDEIRSSAINKWLFNKDTVFKVLDQLMENGLKIEGGDKLGRSIIFAVNQKHAQFIVDCFAERYPEQPSGFISTVHNKVSHAESLIKAFCNQEEEKLPQIAVSVDMMDTGIDAPRVLNLVFFKVVRSYAKFWQMIGRGTRLCPDIFAFGHHKEKFLIFDVCQNFEFFAIEQNGKSGDIGKPLTQRIFESRLQLSILLAETGESDHLEQSKELRDMLHSAIATLDKRRFQVGMQFQHVEEFEKRERWNILRSDDVHIIEEHLSDLPVPESTNENARVFDLMMLRLQIANLLLLSAQKGYHQKLIEIAEELSTKYNIPQVMKSKVLIESMKDPDFYKKLSIRKIEEIRVELRELVQYLEHEKQPIFYTNITDSDAQTIAGDRIVPYENAGIYKRRVESFIRENQNLLVIAKIKSNEVITTEELKQLEAVLFDGSERGTREDFIKEYGEQPLAKFIRNIIGLDVTAAQQAFAEFIQSGNLTADQIKFINSIISFLTKNGTIENKMLFEPPFTDMNDQGVLGVFEDAEAYKIISIIQGINNNVEVG
ncbi:MAG: DEAD/DEAH box helicase family protein [Cyclobacteriaceae bacterium]